jgi:hypothetical protein
MTAAAPQVTILPFLVVPWSGHALGSILQWSPLVIRTKFHAVSDGLLDAVSATPQSPRSAGYRHQQQIDSVRQAAVSAG